MQQVESRTGIYHNFGNRNINPNNGTSYRIDVVVPVYNEERRLPALFDTFSKQQFGVNTHLIFSDNHSTDRTPQVVKSFGKDNVNPKLAVSLIDGSVPKSIGSARRVGVECALDLRRDDEKQIVLFIDADTVFANRQYLNSILKEFKENPNLQVSFGPSEFKMSNGTVIKPPAEVLRLMRRYILWRSFNENNRTLTDFINSPYDIFPGHNFALNGDALSEITGFRDSDVAADDVRVSLELQQKFPKTGILFNRKQKVITDGRAYENGHGFSPKKVIQTLKGMHAPSSMSSMRNEDSTTSIVRSFIEETERRIYNLGENEIILGTVSKHSRIPIKDAEYVRPARDLKTGAIKDDYLVLIGRRK